jgi:dUTP pyrophosphatase
MYQTVQTLGVYAIPNTNPTLPKFATEGSACFDIHARLHTDHVVYYDGNTGTAEQKKVDTTNGQRKLWVFPGQRVLIPTGIILDIPQGFSVRLHARSGLALKSGLVLTNAEGVIDHDYTQELLVMVSNTSTANGTNGILITDNMRLCQGELVQNIPTSIQWCADAPVRETRNGGFGSTGVGA